jgi:hypothetical protein
VGRNLNLKKAKRGLASLLDIHIKLIYNKRDTIHYFITLQRHSDVRDLNDIFAGWSAGLPSRRI